MSEAFNSTNDDLLMMIYLVWDTVPILLIVNGVIWYPGKYLPKFSLTWFKFSWRGIEIYQNDEISSWNPGVDRSESMYLKVVEGLRSPTQNNRSINKIFLKLGRWELQFYIIIISAIYFRRIIEKVKCYFFRYAEKKRNIK